ncbi:hypothetical protein FAIPA1_130138 [Frankia sp. AiPs1]
MADALRELVRMVCGISLCSIPWLIIAT